MRRLWRAFRDLCSQNGEHESDDDESRNVAVQMPAMLRELKCLDGHNAAVHDA